MLIYLPLSCRRGCLYKNCHLSSVTTPNISTFSVGAIC